MKNYYLFFLLIASSMTINGQANCDDANSYIVNAYSHVKDSYEANNISHLKYYANRSLEAFNLSKTNLTNCGCQTALDLADKAIDLLSKVESAETFEDGRFFVKRAKEASKESMIEIDKCSVNAPTNEVPAADVVASTSNQELTDLQNEELKLKQQQEALKQKQEQLKQKLALQKEKELKLKKEQLILSYKSTISTNLKTYNETLKICDCNNHSHLKESTPEDLSTKSIEEIKSYYTSSLKSIASNYLSELDLCDD